LPPIFSHRFEMSAEPEVEFEAPPAKGGVRRLLEWLFPGS
jgi:hypothetical protein